MNDHAIKLEEGKQLPYGPIYSPGSVELETLKTYIESNLNNGFIRPFMSPAGAPILFDRKPDGSLRLCVDYPGLNNLTIENRYPLLLIGESLDRLGRDKRFTQLDLTSAYHRMRIREGDECLSDPIQSLRVPGHAFWTFQRSGQLPGLYQLASPKSSTSARHLRHRVFGRHSDLYEDPGQPHVEAVRWVLDQLRKHGLYANLKKCRFHQDKVRFLEDVVSAQGVGMEEETIEAVRTWPEPQSARDIQFFLGFVLSALHPRLQ